MSRARRVGLLACGLVLLGVTVLPHAGAQTTPDPTTPTTTDPTTPTTTETPTTEPPSRWDGSWDAPLDGGSGSVDTATVSLTGWFSYGPATSSGPVGISEVSLSVIPSGDLPSGCNVPDPPPQHYDQNRDDRTSGRIRQDFSFDDLDFECNGEYSVVATAYFGEFGSEPDPSAPSTTRRRLRGTLDVGAPAPSVSGLLVTVTPDGKSVRLSWDAVSDPPPDFQGYRVMRAADGGELAPVTATTTSTQATDEPPAGHYRYAVVSVRPGPNGEPILSPVATERNVTLGAAAVSAPPASVRSTGGAAIARPHSAGVVRRSGPTSPPTTADTGYKETLDYGNARLPGSEGEGELGSGVVHILGTPARRRGIVIPAAAALVLAMWAAHFRYLAYRARLPEV